MSNELCLIGKQLLTDIANAIRSKTGKTALIYPKDMDTEILSIETGLSPITVNIVQSANQTIKVNTSNISDWTNKTTSGTYSAPTGIRLTATITPANGYSAGSLNQSSIVASWGDTVSFSASPAIQYVPFSITVNVDPSSYTSEANGLNSSYLTYTIAGVGFTLIPGQTVTEYVPPNTDYNVSLRSIDGYSWSHTRVQGNTGNGNSLTLTLSKSSGTLTIYTRYQSGSAADCQYTGTVAGRTVSGNTEGTLRFTEYVGESYNIRFMPPDGYTLSSISQSGTFRTSMSPYTIIVMQSTDIDEPIIE